MSEWDVMVAVESTLVDEMGYSRDEARQMMARHGERIRDAIYYLPRRLAMQIELLEVKRSDERFL